MESRFSANHESRKNVGVQRMPFRVEVTVLLVPYEFQFVEVNRFFDGGPIQSRFLQKLLHSFESIGVWSELVQQVLGNIVQMLPTSRIYNFFSSCHFRVSGTNVGKLFGFSFLELHLELDGIEVVIDWCHSGQICFDSVGSGIHESLKNLKLET